MSVEVKICGLKTPAALQAALEAGADYIGLVFYPRSPRNVDLATAAELADLARPRAQPVALLVDADDAFIAEVGTRVRPAILQLHGKETPARVREIKAATGLEVMKVLHVETVEDVARSAAYDGAADRLMFEAKPPRTPGALPGGNGVSFDWRILGDFRDRWYMLSGGLNPTNVAEAIAIAGPSAVDVSSGVERAPGEKDPALIRAFIRAAKAARPRTTLQSRT